MEEKVVSEIANPPICLSYKALGYKTTQEEGWGNSQFNPAPWWFGETERKADLQRSGSEDETLNHKSEQESTPVRQSKRTEKDSAVVGKPMQREQTKDPEGLSQNRVSVALRPSW